LLGKEGTIIGRLAYAFRPQLKGRGLKGLCQASKAMGPLSLVGALGLRPSAAACIAPGAQGGKSRNR
jgi:hypothetical protein